MVFLFNWLVKQKGELVLTNISVVNVLLNGAEMQFCVLELKLPGWSIFVSLNNFFGTNSLVSDV